MCEGRIGRIGGRIGGSGRGGNDGYEGGEGTLSGGQRLALRLYLSVCEPIASLSKSDCEIIRKLPVFCSLKSPDKFFSLASKNEFRDEKKINSSFVSVTHSSYSSHPIAIGSNNISYGESKNASTLSSLWESSRDKPFVVMVHSPHSSSSSSSPLTLSSSPSLPTGMPKDTHNSGPFPTEILPPHILKYETQADLSLLKKLGVTIISKSEFYRFELLPRVSDLMRCYPSQTVTALVHMLEELRVLAAEDVTFVEMLRGTAFLPSFDPSPVSSAVSSAVSASSSFSGHTTTATALTTTPSNLTITPSIPTRTPSNSTPHSDPFTPSLAPTLHLPSSLFDPHSPELRALLSPTRFPSSPFCEEHLRPALRSVGLAHTLEWPDIIECAKSIESAGCEEERVAMLQSGHRDNRDNRDNSDKRDGSEYRENTGETGDTEAAKRGIALLRFLDLNINRLVSPPPPAPSQPSLPSLLSGFRSFFTETRDVEGAGAAGGRSAR